MGKFPCFICILALLRPAAVRRLQKRTLPFQKRARDSSNEADSFELMHAMNLEGPGIPGNGCIMKQKSNGNQVLPTDVVVKIHATGARPSYIQPWQVLHQKSWTGTGFVIEGHQIMTNAHVVQDQTVLHVQKQENPKKFRAKVLVVAHDLDLAIVAVEEEGFWDDLPCSKFADTIPHLYSEVKAVGFPTGGATVCVTKGIVSRVDAQVYVHARSSGLRSGARNAAEIIVLQIDAAINAGNSGGPAFDKDGEVVGIASSGMPAQQNVGYIIPTCIVQMLLAEFKASGKWSGISEAGFMWNPLESTSMRKFLHMGEHDGVLVAEIAPMGALKNKLEVGDIITHIDGLDVTNEGAIPVDAAGQTVFLDMNAQITRKGKGEMTTLRVLRKGEKLDVSAALGPIPSLAPRFHGYDAQPDFVLIGGIVFTRGSVPLRNQYFSISTGQRPPMDYDWLIYMEAFKEEPEHEVVTVLTILENDVNVGYKAGSHGVLYKFNDQPVRNLAQLASLYGEAQRNGTNEYMTFRFLQDADHMRQFPKSSAEGPPDIVLERVAVEAADREICKTHQILSVTSKAMLPYFNGESSWRSSDIGI